MKIQKKRIILDIIVFTLIIILMIYLLIMRSSNQDINTYNNTELDTIMAIGLSEEITIGDSEPIEITTTKVTTIETSTITTTQTTPPSTTTDVISTTTTTEELTETPIDYNGISRASLPSDKCATVGNLMESNPDTRGWISITNTNINYAFTQSGDNDFYLSHDFDGNESGAGWIFMDYKCYFDGNGNQSDVITLYGHNMANGSMFSTLKKYRDNSDFYEKNPIIAISGYNSFDYYKIFAYMICNGWEGSDFEFWNYSDLSNPNDFYYYVNSAFKKSLIITGVDVQYGDKLLALSTCNTGSSSNHDRFVVLARKVRQGEDLYEGCYRIR